MKVTVIGRLHFLVSSRSRAGLEHLVDLEPDYDDPRHRYFCSCERFTLSPDYHHTPCHHIEAAVRMIRPNYQEWSDPAGSASSSAAGEETGNAAFGSRRYYTVDQPERATVERLFRPGERGGTK